MRLTYYLPLVFVICMICTGSYSQEPVGMQDRISVQPMGDPSPVNGFDFFASEEPLQMTLSFDIKALVKSKLNQEYFDASLTVKVNDTVSVSQPIKIKARGNFRCSFCSFPPIMLKFKNRDDEIKPLAGKTLKLVTHCNLTPKFEEYLLKEYLAYRLFNLVASYSYKTRLATINYIDHDKPENSFTAYGILIENETMLAERNDAVIINSQKFTPKDMNAADMTRVALFNFMIGNTDWSVQCQHNIKILISSKGLTGKGIPVAYDFDYSGLVNTYYSAPYEELPIKSVTDRYYQGLCLRDEELKPILEEFGGLKEQMLGTIHDFEYLSKGAKKQVESYINGFYDMYKNQNYMISQLNSMCMSF